MKTFLTLAVVIFVGICLYQIWKPNGKFERLVANVSHSNAIVAEPPAKPEPWTIVCDGAGHWNYYDADATLYSFAFDSRNEAERVMQYMRELPARTALSPEKEADYARRRKIAENAKWVPCEELEAPKAEVTPLKFEETGAINQVVASIDSNRVITLHEDGNWMTITDSTMPSKDATFRPEKVTIAVKVEPTVTKTADGWEITFRP